MAAKYVTPKIPTNITVHLGAPDDTSAKNITVPFQEYIKNVASSEVYPNWPTDAIKANIIDCIDRPWKKFFIFLLTNIFGI